jgi:hypothetical protein
MANICTALIAIGMFVKALITKLIRIANNSQPFDVIEDKIVFLRF